MTTARYLVGDVFDRMAELPDHSIDLVLTSPPFLALRSYLPENHPDKDKEIGSEATPAEFLDTLLALTAEWGRLLAPHGSICVELGDTYAGSGGAGGDYGPDGLRDGQERFNGAAAAARAHATKERTRSPGAGWPLDKSLCGIPTLYAWSLAYGRNLLTGQPSPAGQWRVRNLVAWVRPNPPVGALGDKFRPATSYLTIATKARDRYFDLDAVRTPSSYDRPNLRGNGARAADAQVPGQCHNSSDHTTNSAGAPPLDWWNHVDTLIDDEIRARAGKPNGGTGDRKGKETDPGRESHPGGWSTFTKGGGHQEKHTSFGAQGSHIRRRLEQAGYLGGPQDDVWDIAPTGYPGAHYAVYPPELCVRPILAMTPQRVCTTCGQPSRRITEQTPEYAEFRRQMNNGEKAPASWDEAVGNRASGFTGNIASSTQTDAPERGPKYVTTGWSDCGHGTWRPGHVLDPFAGSGTTLAVATGHGRQATGIDLDPRNAQLAQERCGMFLTIEESPAVAS